MPAHPPRPPRPRQPPAFGGWIAAGLLAAGPAAADAPAWSLAPWAGTGHYAAQEPGGGGPLNREDGRLAGAGLRLDAAHAGHRWRVRVSRWQGDVAYQGRTQLGLPLRTRSDLRLDHVQVHWSPPLPGAAGAVEASGADSPWQFAFGLGRRRVDRAIRASGRSGALREVLDMTTAGVALTWQADLGAATRLQVRGQLDWPLSQHLWVDSGAVFDRFRLAPGARLQSALSLNLRHALDAAWALSLDAGVEAGRQGASPPVRVARDGRPAGIARYPGGRQRTTTVALAVERNF